MLTQNVQIVTNQSVGWCLAQVLGNQPSKGDSKMNKVTYENVVLKNIVDRGTFITGRLNDYTSTPTGKQSCLLTTEVAIFDSELIEKVAKWTSDSGEFKINATGVETTRFDRRPQAIVDSQDKGVRRAPRNQVILSAVELV